MASLLETLHGVDNVGVGEHEQDGEEEEEDDGGGEVSGWEEWEADASFPEEDSLCLFCKRRFDSPSSVFRHCSEVHAFDFWKLREQLHLDFYDCMRVINFVRAQESFLLILHTLYLQLLHPAARAVVFLFFDLSDSWCLYFDMEDRFYQFQVAANTCWSCGIVLESEVALHEHLENFSGSRESGVILGCARGKHGNYNASASAKLLWQHDKYLTPFLENDPLLYSLEDEMDGDTEEQTLSREDVVAMLEENEVESLVANNGNDIKDLLEYVKDEIGAIAINALTGMENGSSPSVNKHDAVGSADASIQRADDVVLSKKRQKGNLKVSFAEVAAKERYSINQNYFGSYSTFGIHREMLSDKVRTEAYQHAVERNPSLFKGAIVMDLGCGTGILSLFAAKAGARKVISVEGSKRMAMIAQQVATANGYSKGHEAGNVIHEGKDVIDVIEGMVEELDLRYGKVDVLVSEWMGYCLLFESMLSSVLFARDRWLKPGGAILPDIAMMYAAGFGVGGTSLPFWENVYGFDMTCIGKEVLNDASTSPIVDVIDSKEIVTDTCLLQVFDVASMADQDVDFTSSFELRAKATFVAADPKTDLDNTVTRETESGCIWCHGLVLWFDTHFSGRFCKENPVVLSTSPYAPKTHWSQTLLTFEEPVCLSTAMKFRERKCEADVVGTAALPAGCLKGRISIARSSRHRSIDISLETSAVDGDTGVARTLPVQIFDL